jgi:pimeloyl-ACP methyl ester carboxylesterase
MNEEEMYRKVKEEESTAIICTPLSQTILLPSGRQLGIAEQGDPQGKSVFFFHGFAGSRLQCPADGALMARIGVRLISVDRPGIGLSDRAQGRHLLDWPTDIKQLSDHLKLQHHPWGFTPGAIAIPSWIWQGDADTSVLPTLADELAQKLQQSQMTLFPGEGHFLLFTHWPQMLQTLALAF